MKKVLFILAVFIFCVSGFFRANPFTVTLPSDHMPFDWPTSTPEEQGLDPYIFSNANEKAEELEFMYSLLVVRNGYLISEQYFNNIFLLGLLSVTISTFKFLEPFNSMNCWLIALKTRKNRNNFLLERKYFLFRCVYK